MTVSRGTKVTDARGVRTLQRLPLTEDMRRALDEGRKTAHRFVVDHGNSEVKPGSFAGLDLDSGRARRSGMTDIAHLRARCRFGSGDVRAVSVTSAIKRNDLYWVAGWGEKLTTSRYTLEVAAVDVARLQDLSDAQALAEGIPPDVVYSDLIRQKRSPRERFALQWDRWRHGRDPFRRWRANPWVWVVQFNVHPVNVRDMFPGERIGACAGVQLGAP